MLKSYTTKRFYGPVLAPAVSILMLTAINAESAEIGVTKTEVHIGTTNALTGPVALCANVSHGSHAYFAKVNAAGGVNGRKIVYTVLDDAYSAQRAIGNARRLISQNKVFALVSGCGTATGAAVLSFVESDGTPYLFPYVGVDQMVEPPKPNVFSLLPLYKNQLASMIDYVAKKHEIKTAALASINIAGLQGWTEAVRQRLAAANIQLVTEQVMEVTSPDKAPFVTHIKSLNPDLVIIGDSAPGGARFVIEMARQGLKPKHTLGWAALSDEVFVRAAGEAGEGVIAPALLVPVDHPNAKECVDALKSHDASISPSSLTMFGCLAAKVFVEALRRTGDQPTRAGLLAEIKKISNYDSGISGPVTFGADRPMGLSAIYPVVVEKGSVKVLSDPIPVQ